MIYLERKPAPPLTPFIRALWYANVPAADHRHERVLPSGCVEIILNLAGDFLTDIAEGRSDSPAPPALVVGARSVYEVIDTADLASLIGIHFEPGGFAPFIADRTDCFTNHTLPLADLWGPSGENLRDALREIDGARARLEFLEKYLLRRFATPRPRSALVEFALDRFRRDSRVLTVREVAKSTGWSERRFSQVFREEVGFPPKVWIRIQRFQRAVKQLHGGADMPWADLALDCGFYDQSHFANEFRAFSGIDATTYSARQTRWAGHVTAD